MSLLDGLGKCIMENITQYSLYIDMDGVLTNFDKAFTDIGIDIPFRDFELKYGKIESWNVIHERGGLDFWKNMEWMPDGKILWSYVKQYNPIILTSPAAEDESWQGKKMWIERELGDVVFIFERDKFKYARNNRILIDDFFKKIDGWNEHGGVGILHKSAEETIKELQKYGF